MKILHHLFKVTLRPVLLRLLSSLFLPFKPEEDCITVCKLKQLMPVTTLGTEYLTLSIRISGIKGTIISGESLVTRLPDLCDSGRKQRLFFFFQPDFQLNGISLYYGTCPLPSCSRYTSKFHPVSIRTHPHF